MGPITKLKELVGDILSPFTKKRDIAILETKKRRILMEAKKLEKTPSVSKFIDLYKEADKLREKRNAPEQIQDLSHRLWVDFGDIHLSNMLHRAQKMQDPQINKSGKFLGMLAQQAQEIATIASQNRYFEMSTLKMISSISDELGRRLPMHKEDVAYKNFWKTLAQKTNNGLFACGRIPTPSLIATESQKKCKELGIDMYSNN